MIRVLTTVLAAGLLIASCRSDSQKPDDLIEEATYIDLMAELFLTRKTVELKDALETEDSLRNVIFDHYQVSREQFERSHEYYERQTTRQIARLDSIQSLLREEREALMRARQRAREQEVEAQRANDQEDEMQRARGREDEGQRAGP